MKIRTLTTCIVISLIFAACKPSTQPIEEKNQHEASQELARGVESEQTPKASSGEAQIGTASGITGTGKWWDSRTIFFNNFSATSPDAIYEIIKGQPYFPDTRIFVYATDTHSEGTGEYAKVEGSMQETSLDNRIFLWVHLDENQNLVFLRKLISENIKDKLEQAPLKI